MRRSTSVVLMACRRHRRHKGHRRQQQRHQHKGNRKQQCRGGNRKQRHGNSNGNLNPPPPHSLKAVGGGKCGGRRIRVGGDGTQGIRMRGRGLEAVGAGKRRAIRITE